MVAGNHDERFDFASYVHNYISDQIKFSDTKAQILLAVAGVLLSLMLGSVGDKAFRQGGNTLFLYLLCVSVLLFSVVLFLFSLYPRVKKPKESDGLLFWASIVEKDIGDYVSAVQKLDSGTILIEITASIYSISCIAWKKHRIVEFGIAVLFVALILSTVVWLSLIGIRIPDP